MSVVKEGPGIKARANILASEALEAQLGILQIFLPIAGWLVGKQDGDACAVLAARGALSAFSSEALGRVLENDWHDCARVGGFLFRTATDAEHDHLPKRVPADPRKGYLIMARLEESGGNSMGYVMGLAYEPMVAQLALCAQNLRLCVAAMALVVNLHAELDVAEQMVIEMQRDAFIDPLTGVFNRAGWINRLAHIDALASSTDDDAAIVMLDLDFLKVVNDTRGHAAGDDLLRLTAQTISSVLRSTDSVGRLGGDEFGVVVQHATPAVAESLMGRLSQALAQRDIKISIGMALKSEAGTLKKTMHLADERMYAEKRKKPVPARNRPGRSPYAT